MSWIRGAPVHHQERAGTGERARSVGRRSVVGRAFASAVIVVALGSACEGEGSPVRDEEAAWAWELPPGIPEPVVPADNPMSSAKVELGRALFFDVRLSYDQTMSCGSCHAPERGFGDGEVTPSGSTGEVLARNSQGLANVAYFSAYTWANPLLVSLEAQALVPLFADVPIELGAQRDTEGILQRLREDEALLDGFGRAFPDEEEPVSVTSIIRALASYQRSLVDLDAPYDRFVQGDEAALDGAAQRGLTLFLSERVGCARCHPPPFFTVNVRTVDEPERAPIFVNTGLYNLDGEGAYPEGNAGLYEVTADPADIGRFRVPSLRSVGATAPYMHDGSVSSLAEVVDIYAAGGRVISDGPWAGDGRLSPLKSPMIEPLYLIPEERADLVAFLRSLGDGPEDPLAPRP